jgi:hypothetical protein
MKKLLILTIALLIGIQLQAQYKPVIFGLRVGANMGWVKPDAEEYVSEGIRMGFTWGFIGEFYLMENYAIQTGFNMNFNGGQMEYPAIMDVPAGDSTMAVTGQLHRTYHLKYLQIPLCLKMKSEINDKINIFGKIGLGTSFSLGAKADDEFSYAEGTESDSKKDINDDIALMRESLIVGGGVEFKIKESTALILELTYDNMFNDMLTGDNPATPGTEPKAIHNFVEIGAGIVF